MQDSLEKMEKQLDRGDVVGCKEAIMKDNPLTVSEYKKSRLVFDLRYVNQYLEKIHFKCEDIRSSAKNIRGR